MLPAQENFQTKRNSNYNLNGTTLANGETIRWKAMEFLNKKMVRFMKVNLNLD
jgi:hypothetical protein